MAAPARNIAALLLLGLLAIGGICAMGWYIFMGHGWNVTASNIDDSIGQMDGYTVFLLEGTRPPVTASRSAAQTDNQSSKSSASASASNNETEKASSPASELPSTSDKAGSRETSAATDGLLDPSEELREDLQDEPLTLELLRDDYQEKGATVFLLDMDNKALYSDPLVVAKNGERIGIFFLSRPARPAQSRVAMKLLARQGADFSVAITDDSSLAQAEGGPIDVLVIDERDRTPSRGYTHGRTYCVSTPYIGQIEAIIVSPSGVVSSKTIDTV